MSVISELRHLYKNMVTGQVKDSSQAKRIATGLLGPAIEKLERQQQEQPRFSYRYEGKMPPGWKVDRRADTFGTVYVIAPNGYSATVTSFDRNPGNILRMLVMDIMNQPTPAKITGWPPGMLQDDCKALSKWLSNRPNARQEAREAAARILKETQLTAESGQFVEDLMLLAATVLSPQSIAESKDPHG